MNVCTSHVDGGLRFIGGHRMILTGRAGGVSQRRERVRSMRVLRKASHVCVGLGRTNRRRANARKDGRRGRREYAKQASLRGYMESRMVTNLPFCRLL